MTSMSKMGKSNTLYGDKMKCKFCNENIGNYKIKLYKEIWVNGMLETVLLCTLFVCKECINKDNIKFSKL